MTAFAHITWIVLLAASVLLCLRASSSWRPRPDPRASVVATGAVALACASVVAIHAPAGF